MKRITLILILLITACKKDSDPSGPNPMPTENITSMADFKSRVKLPLQTFGFNISSGFSFTTNKGTIVTIPPDAFEDMGGTAVSGFVTIGFKDIATKSEMVLEGVS